MDNSQPGSFAEIPKSLKDEIKALEEQFVVPKEKLKAITDHFVKELEKGISIPIMNTWGPPLTL